MTQTVPLFSPHDGANPFEFPLDSALAFDDGVLKAWDEIGLDSPERLSEEMFQVEDWSRYMWSPETGFEHIDSPYPPVTASQSQ